MIVWQMFNNHRSDAMMTNPSESQRKMDSIYNESSKFNYNYLVGLDESHFHFNGTVVIGLWDKGTVQLIGVFIFCLIHFSV